MKSLALFCFIAFLSFAYGCGSSESNVDKNTADTTNNTTMVEDTMPDVPIPPPAPAPGTARIEAKIISIEEPEDDNHSFKIKLQPLKVLGYGSSTPALNVNDTLLVTSANLPEELKAGKKLVMVISSNKKILDKKPASKWQIIKIETVKNNSYRSYEK